jgi:hypothetical protein
MRLFQSLPIAVVPFTICCLLACALWLYASMREEYTTVLDIPLEIRLPEGRTLEKAVASEIRAQVQGAGWQLVNHYLSSSIRCVLYISEERLFSPKNGSLARAVSADDEQAFALFPRAALAQAIQAPMGIVVRRVLADSLLLTVGSMTEKRVPIRVVAEVETRPGFILTRPPEATPDSVDLRGSKTVLRKISFWNTRRVVLRDVYEPVSIQTVPDDTLSSLVSAPSMPIILNFSIHQMADMVLDDVPVTVMGAPTRHPYLALPSRVSVVVRGGVESVARLSSESVKVFVDFNDIASASAGTLRPRVQAPGDIQIIGVQPRLLRILKRTRSEGVKS